MITLHISLDVDSNTWENLTPDEWELLKNLIGKLGGEAEIPSKEDLLKADLLNRRIADCPLSPRARRALEVYAGISTTGELISRSGWEVRHIKNIGITTYREIRAFLAGQGLQLERRT